MVRVIVIRDVVVRGTRYGTGAEVCLSRNWALHHIAEGNVRPVPPPYAARKRLRERTLAVGRRARRRK